MKKILDYFKKRWKLFLLAVVLGVLLGSIPKFLTYYNETIDEIILVDSLRATVPIDTTIIVKDSLKIDD